MKKEQILTGEDLRRYILQLLKQKENETEELKKTHPLQRIWGDKISAFPPLLDYLLSLWATAEKYRNVEKITWNLIAQILEEAFDTQPKKVNWEEMLKIPYTLPFNSKANTPEYYEEIRNYLFFEKSIRNDIISLKMVLTYGAKKLGVSSFEYSLSNPNDHLYYWENHITKDFLERGTAFLEEETDWYDNEPEYPVSWSTLELVLKNGRFEE
jgi:hypothetical protein